MTDLDEPEPEPSAEHSHLPVVELPADSVMVRMTLAVAKTVSKLDLVKVSEWARGKIPEVAIPDTTEGLAVSTIEKACDDVL